MYPSNFNDAPFRDNKPRELTRLNEDECFVQQQTVENGKKLKYVITNFQDLADAKEKLNFYGMTVKDKLFVPADNMDEDSFLRYGGNGGIMTNCNIRNVFGQLPFPTMPSRYQLSRGDVETEDSMRYLHEVNKNSCNPREAEYHQRHFYIFDDKNGIETPNAVKSVEPKEFGPRGGVSTRFMKKQQRRTP
jgi:hypothetical protein